MNAGASAAHGCALYGVTLIAGFDPVWLLIPLFVGVISMWLWPRRDH